MSNYLRTQYFQAPQEKLLYTIQEFTTLCMEFAYIKTQNAQTRRAYLSDLRAMGDLCLRGTDMVDLSDRALIGIKVNKLDHMAPRSANRILCTLKKFLKFLVVDKRLLYHNYLATIEGHKVDRYDSPYVALTDAEVIAMIGACDVRTFHGATQRMTMILFFYLGLRVAELCAIRHQDIQDGILSVKGKGGRVRRIPLPDTILDELCAYTSVSAAYWGSLQLSDPLITSRESRMDMDGAAVVGIHTSNMPLGHTGKKRPVAHSTAWRWFKAIAADLGIQKKISPHCARATCITKGLDNGVGIREMGILAGHSSIETTVIYDKRRGEASRNAVNSIKY